MLLIDLTSQIDTLAYKSHCQKAKIKYKIQSPFGQRARPLLTRDLLQLTVHPKESGR